MNQGLVICWSCRGGIDDLPSRMPRYAKCPHCQAELHLCRQCRSFDAKVLGQCSHDRADRVERKGDANFCTYYRVSPQPAEMVEDAASANVEALNELFGLRETEPRESSSTPSSSSDAEAQLNALFGLDDAPGDQAKSGSSKS